MTDCVKRKIEFVKELNKTLPHYLAGIEEVEYVVFEHKDNPNWYREYLVITYTGGAETIRNCTGNSSGAIFEEIAKYVFYGYYDEVIDFQNLMADTENWTMIR